MNEYNKARTSPLPALAGERRQNEARITPRVLAWFLKNYPVSCAIEIKYGANKKLLPHQAAALRKVTLGAFAHKIGDRGARVPFDGFILKNADAIIARCEGLRCEIEVLNTGRRFTIKI